MADGSFTFMTKWKKIIIFFVDRKKGEQGKGLINFLVLFMISFCTQELYFLFKFWQSIIFKLEWLSLLNQFYNEKWRDIKEIVISLIKATSSVTNNYGQNKQRTSCHSWRLYSKYYVKINEVKDWNRWLKCNTWKT